MDRWDACQLCMGSTLHSSLHLPAARRNEKNDLIMLHNKATRSTT
jgi:hypothetical protein